MKKGDGNLQYSEEPENTFIWIESARPALLGHWLARQLALDNSINPADGIDLVENLRSATPFLGEIMIKKKKMAIKQAKKYQVRIVFWTDGSKLDINNVEAAVI